MDEQICHHQLGCLGPGAQHFDWVAWKWVKDGWPPLLNFHLAHPRPLVPQPCLYKTPCLFIVFSFSALAATWCRLVLDPEVRRQHALLCDPCQIPWTSVLHSPPSPNTPALGADLWLLLIVSEWVWVLLPVYTWLTNMHGKLAIQKFLFRSKRTVKDKL